MFVGRTVLVFLSRQPTASIVGTVIPFNIPIRNEHNVIITADLDKIPKHITTDAAQFPIYTVLVGEKGNLYAKRRENVVPAQNSERDKAPSDRPPKNTETYLSIHTVITD